MSRLIENFTKTSVAYRRNGEFNTDIDFALMFKNAWFLGKSFFFFFFPNLAKKTKKNDLPKNHGQEYISHHDTRA